ncbi:hypothetical protein ACWC5I_22825 [Kitasatospora sp. NPDC001574]
MTLRSPDPLAGVVSTTASGEQQTETGVSADLPDGGTVDVDFDGSGRIASVRVGPAGR